jgi:transposase
MPVVHPICGGIDVHQAQLTACRHRVDADGRVPQEVCACATTEDALFTLSGWLTEQQGPVAAMASTGVSWRPVSHVLVGTVEVLVGHAQARRRPPGHTTDKTDARWIAERLAHGLIRPSCVPPPPIGALRDLTRTRVALIQARTPAKNRVVKVREDTTITRTSVVSDRFGRSGRRMLAAFVAGERDPNTLAALALGGLRRQLPQLELALTGRRAGRACQGNRDLRRVLVQCAWAARNTPTFPGRTCRRLEGRLGGKKAAMAVAHNILVIGYHLPLEGTCSEEARDDRLQDRQEEHQQTRAVKTLERLGYRVTWERLA